ncbi:MAG: rhomboid family intramembrane serine protease [Idiomarina sp.]|nr:rhomboid family intramembrane serine protease [Idiomarina sp.]
MKTLYSSANQKEAQQLLRALQRAGIPATAAERGATIDILLIQPGYEATAKEIIQAFKDNPEEFTEQAPLFVAATSPSLWRLLAKQAGIVTFLVFAAVLLTALMQWVIAPEWTISSLLFTPLGMPELSFQQPWRFVTPILLHFSATHLVFNLFWWWYLGGRIELRYGAATLALITIVTALVSNYAQWASSGPLFGGLSGVVYGLLGFVMIVTWQKPTHSLSLPPFLYIFMIGWLLLGYTDILWVNVANEAHALGLISGIVLGFVFRIRDSRSTNQYK